MFICASLHVCIFMNRCLCGCVHGCVSAACWTVCQLRLTWRWVATPRGCAGLWGGLSLISSIRLPCVMVADPRRSVGRDARPLGQGRAPIMPGSGLTSCQEQPSLSCCQIVSGDGKDGTLGNLRWASSRTPCENAPCLWVIDGGGDGWEGGSVVRESSLNKTFSARLIGDLIRFLQLYPST